MDTGLKVMIAPFDLDKEGNPNPPNPTQLKVLEWVDKKREVVDPENIPVLLLYGGVGSGKSRAMMAPVIEMLLEVPNLRVLWARQDLKDINLSICDKFFEILPNMQVVNQNKQYNYYEIAQQGGTTSRIYFNGLKDLSGLSSQEFGVICITEAYETTENAYRTLKRRCRQNGCPNMILMETEPPNEGHWLARLTDPSKEEYDPDIEKWKVSTMENWENLPKAYTGSLLSMPHAWKRKYLYGEEGFIPDGKPFYEGFKEDLHTGEFQWNKDKPILRGWDYGFHHPACIISQVDVNDRWIILREIMGSDVTIDKFADAVEKECNLFYPNAEYIDYGDPAGRQVNDKSEKTSEDILRDKGIKVRSKKSDYRTRKEIIDGKLSKIIMGKPALMVDTKCKIVIDGFLGGYHYRLLKPGQEVLDKYEVPFHDDFYCLTGDTKIRTVTGWHEIKDLVGKEFITYSYDSFSKRIVPSQAKRCWKTKENAEVWKLKLDDGEIKATPNHLIMLRDGSYRQLQDLKEGDELMPFYDGGQKNSLHKRINLNDGSWASEHRYIYNWFIGNLRDGYRIHHKDGNANNNNPENLEQVRADIHMRGVYDAMMKTEHYDNLKKGCVHPWSEESRKKVGYWTRKRLAEKRVEKQCEVCGAIFMGIDWGGRQQKYCSKRCCEIASGRRRRKGISKPYWGIKKCVNCEVEFRGLNSAKYCSMSCRGKYARKKKNLELVNHKVASVEFYGIEDVYDIEVYKYHNFPANGVIVHNSHLLNSIEYIAVNAFTATKQAPRKRITGGHEVPVNAGFGF